MRSLLSIVKYLFFICLFVLSPMLVAGSESEAVREVIRQVYLEVLEREPDAEGLKTYEQHLTREGRDEAWLRDVLSNSPEGAQVLKKRKKRVALWCGVSGIAGVLIGIMYLRRSTTKEFVFRLTLLSFSVFIACLLSEAVMRLKVNRAASRGVAAWEKLESASKPSENAAVHLQHMIRMSDTPNIIYELFPDMSVRFIGAHVNTDEEGFRITPGSSDEAAAYCIVGLGDSVLFGWGVDDGDTYLSKMIGPLSRSIGGRPVRVVNTSVPGYNTVMELETLKAKALKYHPDLVLVHYTENDVYLPNFIPKEDTSVRLTKSHLLAALSRWSGGKRTTRPFERLTRRTSGDEPERYKHMVGEGAVQRALRELHALSGMHGFKLAVVSNWTAKDFLRDVTRELDIPLVELGATLMDYCKAHDIEKFQGSVLTVGEKDPHFSALAHELVAQHVLDELARRDYFSN